MTSFTLTETFTRSNAQYVASKVVTDLARIRSFYDVPTESWIIKYEAELIEFLRAGYLDKVIYGFQKYGSWIEPTLLYTSRDILDASATNDDPGNILPGADISGASFGSHLTYSRAWYSLTEAQKSEFCKSLPFRRTEGKEPGINGYFNADQTYSAGSRALDRSSLRGYQ